MSSSKTLILNCGASHVSLASVNPKGGTLLVEEFYSQALSYDYSDDEAWLTGLTDGVRSLMSQTKLRGDVTVIAPGYQLLTKTIKVPHVEPERQAQIIAFEAQQNIPYPLTEVVWDHQVISDDGVEAEVILIAFKALGANRLCQTLQSLGLRPVKVQASSILEANAFRYLYPNSADTSLVINIGARSSNLMFINNEGFFVRNIALGGNSLTQSLADSMGKPFIQAEQTKLQYFNGQIPFDEADPHSQLLSTSMNTFMRRMGQDITRSIVNYKRQKQGQAPTAIYLTGKGSLIPGLSEYLQESQKVAVDYLDPTQSLIPGPAVDPETFNHSYINLAEILGCATIDVLPNGVSTNLLPPNIAQDQAFAKKKPLLLVSALLIAISPLPFIFSNMQKSASYEEAEKQLQAKARPLQQLHKDIEDIQEEAKVYQDRLASIDTLVKTKNNWINFFVDMQDRLVQTRDVWIDELKVKRAREGEEEDNRRNNNRRNTQTEEATGPINYHLNISGRMLLRSEDGNDEVGLDRRIASKRIQELIAEISESEFIAGNVGEPNFPQDESNTQILKFEFTLNVNPDKPL